MSTLSIVVISILASLFAILLILAIASLVYTHILVRRQISQFSLTVQSVGTKLESIAGSIRGDKIEKAAEEFLQQIPKQAAIATRVERATLLFVEAIKHIGGEFEISGSSADRARASGLGPEDYAPSSPGEQWFSRSRTAASDAQYLAEEAESNTTGQPDEG